jgi:hypothetical protein
MIHPSENSFPDVKTDVQIDFLYSVHDHIPKGGLLIPFDSSCCRHSLNTCSDSNFLVCYVRPRGFPEVGVHLLDYMFNPSSNLAKLSLEYCKINLSLCLALTCIASI